MATFSKKDSSTMAKDTGTTGVSPAVALSAVPGADDARHLRDQQLVANSSGSTAESPKLAPNAVAYLLQSDFRHVNENGQVLGNNKGDIFVIPRDTARVLLIMNCGGDVVPLRHMETCPFCKNAHACTLEANAVVEVVAKKLK